MYIKALELMFLLSLSAHGFAITLTQLDTDKINDTPRRASYYTRRLSHQPLPPLSSSASFSTDINQSVYNKEHSSGFIQLESAAGAGMPHQLIYELAIEYKHIPRVSLLTCQHGSPTRRLREQTTTSINIDTLTILKTLFTRKDNGRYRGNRSDGGNISISGSSSGDRRRSEQFPPKGVLIKVLRIDLLINGQASDSAANKSRSGNAEPLTLEAFLRGELLRQLVVLDLSCGLASRKVIEMASNKGLFNSSYHWLLIEDYTFNRQGDACDVEQDSHLPQDGVTATTNTRAGDGAGATVSSKSKDNKINNYGDDNNIDNETNDSVEGKNLLIEKFLEKINININTELILAKRINGDQNSKEDYYILYDVWSPGIQYGGNLNITEIGKFSEGDGLQLEKWFRQTTTIIRRMDMKNARIRCMIVVTNKNRTDSLEDYLTQRFDTHLDSMNRFNFALLSHVRDLFNFSLAMSRTASWGYLKNGKFDGMIGALVRRQADIGGSPIFFRIERAKVIDYTTRTWIARPCFIFRHPRTLRTDQLVFLQPFTNDVWILVAICGAITMVLLAALTIVEQRFNEDFNKSPDLRLGDGELRNKNAHRTPNGEGGRKTNLNAHIRGKKRQIDIELSSFTPKDALPLARNGIHSLLTGGGDGSNTTTLSNEGFNTRTAIRQGGGHVPADYGAGIFERSAIDCVDYGAGVSGPINAVFPHNNANGAGGSLIERTLRKFFAWWRKHLQWGIPSKDRVEMILESLHFYIGSICQQGLSFSTNLFSGRCIVITSLLFSFFIYQFYSASIVGSLLMEKPKTIKTLRDVVHSSLEIGIEDIIYNRDYFLRTRDPDAIELYAKKVTTLPLYADQTFMQEAPTARPATGKPNETIKEQSMTKDFKAAIHSHESGANAKVTEASNWYDPSYGVAKIKQGGFAFHVDVATAYKIISDTFTEKEICDLTEIQLFPPQKMVSIVQKGSPLRKIITYGLRRTTEAGLMDYQRKVWHSPKPRCVKQIHTDDLRVDMQTFTSAVFVLIFGFAASVVVLVLEMVHNNLWQYFAT